MADRRGKGKAMAEADGPVWALGLMSGTSMDGTDAALLETDGTAIARLGPGAVLDYRESELAALRAVTADPPAFRAAEGEAAATLAEAERAVVSLQARAAVALLAGAVPSPAVVGFHGQTVFHAPEEGWTWQLGDGARLAAALNRTVVWDFRSADMAAGGEGAPLAPFFHWALARHAGLAEPVAVLNLGGVANVTWLDPGAGSPETPGALLAFDTGPGNALIDDFVRARTGAPHDAGGALASAGRARALPRSNAAAAFLARPGPKSLDRNAFRGVLAAVEELPTEEGAATLAAFTAECAAAALPHLPAPPARWLVAGGGRRNAALMDMLGARLGAPVEPVEAIGADGDMLEAHAFAFLAVRVLRGLPTSAPGTTGCRAPVVGGRISRP
jgi:anhydro-N-acetylmuramic acid kinase